METKNPHDNPQTEQSALHQEHTVNNVNAPVNVHIHHYNYFYGTPPPDAHEQQAPHEQQHHAHEQQPYDAQAQAHYEQARHDPDVPIYPLQFPARYQDAYDVEDVDYVEVESAPAQAATEPQAAQYAAPQADTQPGDYPPPGQGTGQFPYITPTPHKTAEQIRQEIWQACEQTYARGGRTLKNYLEAATNRRELDLRGVPLTKLFHKLQTFYGTLPFRYNAFAYHYRRQ